MKKARKYIITITIGLIIAFLIMVLKSIFKQDNARDVMHILTDAFFVSGVLITGYGLLVVSSNGGTFDMLVYGVSKFFNMFRKDMKKEKYKSFYEYRLVKAEEGKNEFWYLVFIGVGFIVVSLIFLAFYYEV